MYIHVVRGSQLDLAPVVAEEFLTKLRQTYGATIILTGSLSEKVAEQLLQNVLADLFGFGALFISNRI